MALDLQLYNPEDFGGVPWNPYGVTIPDSWITSIDATAPGLVDAAKTQTVTPSEDWITTIARTASTVVMADSQRRLLNIQLDRARQGLPPLNSSQYGLGVGVNFGLSPELEKGLMLGGALLLGWFLLRKR